MDFSDGPDARDVRNMDDVHDAVKDFQADAVQDMMSSDSTAADFVAEVVELGLAIHMEDTAMPLAFAEEEPNKDLWISRLGVATPPHEVKETPSSGMNEHDSHAATKAHEEDIEFIISTKEDMEDGGFSRKMFDKMREMTGCNSDDPDEVAEAFEKKYPHFNSLTAVTARGSVLREDAIEIAVEQLGESSFPVFVTMNVHEIKDVTDNHCNQWCQTSASLWNQRKEPVEPSEVDIPSEQTFLRQASAPAVIEYGYSNDAHATAKAHEGEGIVQPTEPSREDDTPSEKSGYSSDVHSDASSEAEEVAADKSMLEASTHETDDVGIDHGQEQEVAAASSSFSDVRFKFQSEMPLPSPHVAAEASQAEQIHFAHLAPKPPTKVQPPSAPRGAAGALRNSLHPLERAKFGMYLVPAPFPRRCKQRPMPFLKNPRRCKKKWMEPLGSETNSGAETSGRKKVAAKARGLTLPKLSGQRGKPSGDMSRSKERDFMSFQTTMASTYDLPLQSFY